MEAENRQKKFVHNTDNAFHRCFKECNPTDYDFLTHLQFVFGCFGKKPGPLLQLSTIPRYMLNEYMMVASIMTLFDLVRATEKV